MTQTAFTVNGLIWAGFTVLVVSGTLLEPNTASALTRLKLGMVLVIAINGLHAHTLQPGLRAARDDIAPDLLARAAATAGQVAIAVGPLDVHGDVLPRLDVESARQRHLRLGLP